MTLKKKMSTWRESLIGKFVDYDNLNENWEVSKNGKEDFQIFLNITSPTRFCLQIACTIVVDMHGKIKSYEDWGSVSEGHGRPSLEELRRSDSAYLRRVVQSILAKKSKQSGCRFSEGLRRDEALQQETVSRTQPVKPLGMDYELFQYDRFSTGFSAQGKRRDHLETQIADSKRLEGEKLENSIGRIVNALLWMEFSIIRDEWGQSVGCVPNILFDRVKERTNYSDCRKMAESYHGKLFLTRYMVAKQTFNDSARAFLDASDGKISNQIGMARFTVGWMFDLRPCLVLPAFDDYGDHQLWGPRDVPWNSIRRVNNLAILVSEGISRHGFAR